MMENKIKKFAIIGAAGYIAPKHMMAIKKLGHSLIAAYDINDSVGILDSISPDCKFFTKFEVFIDYIYLINKNTETKIDYITICSPNYLHYYHIVASLRLGCNVICEKPLVPTTKEVDKLSEIELETGKKIFNILQLRYNEEIINLKDKLQIKVREKKSEVKLVYITRRGNWYSESWKGDENKSFGIVANIGVHFFDLLYFLFGKVEKNLIYEYEKNKASGFIEYEKAKVSWFLSIDAKDLPTNIIGDKPTYRNINIDGEELEFSNGFNDLHEISYKEIIKNRGFDLTEVRACIETIENIYHSKVV